MKVAKIITSGVMIWVLIFITFTIEFILITFLLENESEIIIYNEK